MRNRLRTLCVCAMLEFGALIGLPMRPEEIQELMRTMNQPKLVQSSKLESEKDDPGTGDL